MKGLFYLDSKQLNELTEQILVLLAQATDAKGLRVVVLDDRGSPITTSEVQNALLGALTAITGAHFMAKGTKLIAMSKDGAHVWPPHRKEKVGAYVEDVDKSKEMLDLVRKHFKYCLYGDPSALSQFGTPYWTWQNGARREEGELTEKYHNWEDLRSSFEYCLQAIAVHNKVVVLRIPPTVRCNPDDGSWQLRIRWHFMEGFKVQE